MAKPPKSAPPTKSEPFHPAFAGLEKLRAAMQSESAPPQNADRGPSKAPKQDPSPQEEDREEKATFVKPNAKVVVAMERKGHGGKTVTRVEGILSSKLEEIMKELKRSLGCGASIDEENILLQGDHRKRAAEWLTKKGVKRVVVAG